MGVLQGRSADERGSIENCVSSVNVKCEGAYAGGLAGEIRHDATIKNCRASGLIDATLSGTGGLIGFIANHVIVENCNASGDIINSLASYDIGGLVGIADTDCAIRNCYATGDVNIGGISRGGVYIGGLVGGIQSTTIENCYATGKVFGYDNVGGLVGFMSGADSEIKNCVALNPTVVRLSGVETSFGRVAGYAATYNDVTHEEEPIDFNISGCYAFSGMVSPVVTPSGALDNKNGANLDAASISASGDLGMTTTFTSGNGWTTEAGKLPGLFGSAVDMPIHLNTAAGTDIFESGTGIQSDPYIIATSKQMSDMAQLVNSDSGSYRSSHYKLNNDIDLSAYGANYNGGKGWIPIGGSKMFSGSFDGNNKKITGLYINAPESTNMGLFNTISGKVENLTIENCVVTGDYSPGGLTGSISSGGKVTNCSITGAISGSGTVGGLVGNVNNGTITNCHTSGTVSGSSYCVGGLVGNAAFGTITNCSSNAGISGGSDVSGCSYVGGLIGDVSGSSSLSIVNCYATGAVTGTADVGGLVGSVNYIYAGNIIIDNCYATGTAKSNGGSGEHIGGLVGFAQVNIAITNCYATGAVEGIDYIGGLVGFSSSVSIKNCVALNPSLNKTSRNENNFGRVVGFIYNGALLGNYAYEEMLVDGSIITDGQSDNKNGENLSRNLILQGDNLTMSSVFNSNNGWTTAGGMLLGLLDKPVDMPLHLNPSNTQSPFEGDGTEATPYKIATAEQLAKLSELVNVNNANFNNKHYELQNDIDLSSYSKNFNDGKGWIPIGHEHDAPFKGVFDGNGYKITGLYINNPAQEGSSGYACTGLFGRMMGRINDLNVEGGSVNGGSNVGGLAGIVEQGGLDNCRASVKVQGDC